MGKDDGQDHVSIDADTAKELDAIQRRFNIDGREGAAASAIAVFDRLTGRMESGERLIMKDTRTGKMEEIRINGRKRNAS